jgi:cytochrome c peroxidase
MSRRSLLPLLFAVIALFSCGAKDDRSLADTASRVFGPIPQAKQVDSAALVSLGRSLYFSNELSVNRTQSCNSCHPVDGHAVGADRLTTSRGALGDAGRRNSPTVLNAAFHNAQFWDGRAATLEQQAQGPMLNPIEMAMPDEAAVAERLRNPTAFDHALFASAFPGERDPYTIKHAALAIAAFERTLRTHDRFDKFQQGDVAALSADEKAGLRLFMSYGCTSCHNGPLLGANKFMKLGVVNPYDNASDRGRAELTKNRGDDFVFKVPALRNVAMTGPYFHDGRVKNLPQAVERMAWHQLGRKIEAKDRDLIVAFLKSLSDIERGPAAVASR